MDNGQFRACRVWCQSRRNRKLFVAALAKALTKAHISGHTHTIRVMSALRHISFETVFLMLLPLTAILVMDMRSRIYQDKGYRDVRAQAKIIQDLFMTTGHMSVGLPPRLICSKRR